MRKSILFNVFASLFVCSAFAAGHSHGHKPASAADDKKNAEKECRAETPGKATKMVDDQIAEMKKANKNAHFNKETMLASAKKEAYEECMKSKK